MACCKAVLLSGAAWVTVLLSLIAASTTPKPPCLDGTYEPACTACGHCKDGVHCDKTNGNCPGECAPGFTGMPACTTECASGKWGLNCVSSCSTHCTNTCDKVNGNCNCAPGYKPTLCTDACDNGMYGQNCGHACGRCEGSAACDKVTGNCLACQAGYLPPFCQADCQDGKWGRNCDFTCSPNCQSGICDKATGVCTCKPGYKPGKCTDACDNGNFGQDCRSTCGQCVDGEACDKATGKCTCKPGYQTPTCQAACSSGKYGQNCQETCGDCISGDICNHIDGSCKQCADNKQLPWCKDCIPGHWGVTCGQLCGHCGGNGACERNTGLCAAQPCQDGWKSANCEQKCEAGAYGPNCSRTCGNCRDGGTCRHDNGICETECQDGYEGVLCQRQEKDLTGAIVGSIFGAAVILAVTIVAVTCYFKRGSTKKTELPTRHFLPMDDTTSVRSVRSGADGTNYQNFEFNSGATSPTTNHNNLHPIETYDKVDLSKRENHLYDQYVTSPAFGASATAEGSDPIYQNSELSAGGGKKKAPKMYGKKHALKPLTDRREATLAAYSAPEPVKQPMKPPEALYGNLEP